MMPAIKGAPPYVAGPLSPDSEHVVPPLQFALPRPKGQHRALYSPITPVGFVQRVIYRRPGAIVLAHRMDGRRIGKRPSEVLESLSADIGRGFRAVAPPVIVVRVSA